MILIENKNIYDGFHVLQDPFAARFVPFPPTDERRIYSAWFASENMHIDFHFPYAKGADDAMSNMSTFVVFAMPFEFSV